LEEHTDTKTSPKSAPDKGTSTSSRDEKQGADVDFVETLRAVVLLILNRLVTALEYEQEGFLDLATKRSKKNYLDLMAPQHFDKLLRETFDLDALRPADPEVEPSDPSYEQQRYIRLLETCERAPFRVPVPSADKFALAIQKASKATQKELRESAVASDSSDLKIHLFFFAKALDVVDGDIVSHHELLYSNVDDMTEPK